MEAAAITKKKKRIPEPHAYVMLFLVICLAMVLTWVIPAGNFDRTLDEATGRTLVVPGTYHHVEDTPVNPIQMITCIFKGFENAAQTVFFTFFVFVYINTIFKTGAFAGALKANDKVALIGFGTFAVSERPARTGINPATKAKIEIPAKKVIKFKAGAELAEGLN